MLKNIILSAGLIGCVLTGYGQLPIGWTVNPADYNYSMTLAGQVIENCTELTDNGNAIAAFVAGECRGVAFTDVDAGLRKLGFLTIYSNNASGENVQLRFFNSISGQETIALDGCVFLSNAVIGNVADPFPVLNNHRPTGISLSNNTVQESTPQGGMIGIFSGQDTDEQSLTFSLSGNFPDNASFDVTGNELLLNTILDFAAQVSYQIEVSVNDGAGCSYTDTFAILVDDNAFPPVAENDTVTTNEDTPVAIDVPANDSDYDNDIDVSSVNIISFPLNGTIVISAEGGITYTPDTNYFGSDSFTYVICDLTNTGSLCDTAQVFIDVLPVADAPLANDDFMTTNEETSVTITVLSNDTVVEGDIDNSSVNVYSGPSNGTASVFNGTIVYTPDDQYDGTDTLYYSVCDMTLPDALCDTAMVVIVVSPLADAPTDIIIDTLTVIEDNEPDFLISHIYTADTDIPDDSFVYELVSGFNDSDNEQFTINGDMLSINDKTNYDIKNTYHIRIRTTDNAGLFYEKPFDILVEDITGNDIPLPASTYISNNGDGRNDYLTIQNVAIYDYFSLKVFDQFGNVVFEQDSNYNNDWDGTKNGEKLPSGAYYYLFRSDMKTYKGNVTIVN